ncbi:MAG: hypothetical protein VZQ98_09260 [Bacteroidales bacterium]|nr:hypothetical protein [Bacteroidales bacterium]
MNPRILEPILEGYKLKRKIIDENQWLLGGYIFEAVSIALGNMAKKKGQKPDNYFEEIKRPALQSINTNNGELTEEEKQKRLDLLVAGLRIKQANFELAKQQKKRQ